MDAPPERRFLGFDAYRRAIDCLRPGDVALLTTFSSFRAQHFEYAVERGVNVFMEKTFGPDTLEPVIQQVLAHARQMKPAQFMAAMAMLNTARRQYGTVFAAHDVWLTPSTARVAEPWGRYNLGRSDVSFDDIATQILAPVSRKAPARTP